jgi:hypothetical protein
MDLDSAVEPDLDPLGLFLPLPYRIAILLVLGKSTNTRPSNRQAFGHGVRIYIICS